MNCPPMLTSLSFVLSLHPLMSRSASGGLPPMTAPGIALIQQAPALRGGPGGRRTGQLRSMCERVAQSAQPTGLRTVRFVPAVRLR
jgi:hypothetical protein